MTELPLGKPESQELEFKSRQVLEDFRGVVLARAVAAMMNGDGGVIWVGVRERSERAVDVEPIADPKGEIRRSWDHLGDVLEPKPTHDDLAIEHVPCAGGAVLRFEIFSRADRGPVAVLQRQARLYPLRTGARTRLMTHEELAARFRKAGTAAGDPARQLEAARDEIRKVREADASLGGSRFLLSAVLAPPPEGGIDVLGREVRELLKDPGKIKVSGDLYASVVHPRIDEWTEQRKSPRSLTAGDPAYRALEVFGAGRTTFRSNLRALARPLLPGMHEDLSEIQPVVLLGLVVSFARVSAKLFGLVKPVKRDRVVLDLSLTVSPREHWVLRPGSPQANLFADPVELGDYELPVPTDVAWPEFDEDPDRVAAGLVARLYQDFGLSREDLPKFYDPRSGRFTLWE